MTSKYGCCPKCGSENTEDGDCGYSTFNVYWVKCGDCGNKASTGGRDGQVYMTLGQRWKHGTAEAWIHEQQNLITEMSAFLKRKFGDKSPRATELRESAKKSLDV